MSKPLKSKNKDPIDRRTWKKILTPEEFNNAVGKDNWIDNIMKDIENMDEDMIITLLELLVEFPVAIYLFFFKLKDMGWSLTERILTTTGGSLLIDIILRAIF
jgi:hypothetical protein